MRRDRVNDFILVLIGVVIGGMIAVPLMVGPLQREAQRQAQWENRTLACWPTKDDPTPVRHP